MATSQLFGYTSILQNIFCVQQKKETQLQGEQVMTEYNILINCPFNSLREKLQSHCFMGVDSL